MNKEQRIDAIFDKYEQALQEFDTCDLGSCQYKTIQDTAEFVLALIQEIGVEGVEKASNMKYTRKITDHVEFERELTEECEATNWVDSDNDRDYPSFKEFLEKEHPEYLDDYRDRRISIQAYMEMTRCQSWDLWTAMLSIFENLEMVAVELPTYGPMFNQMAQGENFEHGVNLAFMLHYFGDFGLTMQDFAGFDT